MSNIFSNSSIVPLSNIVYYIEKIIQLPISIPELSETDIKNYLLLLICELFLSKRVPSTKENQLDILLAKVKETNVFVNGIKIDLEFVRSAFNNLIIYRYYKCRFRNR